MSKCGPNCRPSISRSHVIDWSAALTRKKNVDKLTAEMRSMESLTEQSTHWKCYRVKKALWWPILRVCKWLCVEQTSGEAGSQRYTLRVGFISACLQRPEGRVGSCGETLWCGGKGSTSRAQIVYFKLVCFGCWLSSFFLLFLIREGIKVCRQSIQMEKPTFRQTNLTPCVRAAPLKTTPITSSWGFKPLSDLLVRKNTCKYLTLRRMLDKFIYQEASSLSQLG